MLFVHGKVRLRDSKTNQLQDSQHPECREHEQINLILVNLIMSFFITVAKLDHCSGEVKQFVGEACDDL